MSVPIIEGEGSSEAGHGNACLYPSADHPPPGVLSTESRRSVAESARDTEVPVYTADSIGFNAANETQRAQHHPLPTTYLAVVNC